MSVEPVLNHCHQQTQRWYCHCRPRRRSCCSCCALLMSPLLVMMMLMMMMMGMTWDDNDAAVVEVDFVTVAVLWNENEGGWRHQEVSFLIAGAGHRSLLQPGRSLHASTTLPPSLPRSLALSVSLSLSLSFPFCECACNDACVRAYF